ncbi:MAG: N-acetyl-gamma-glutamyl-phosphate reductase [Verrucomicrobiales bacterium]|jgi:N-acetyl-gamma-glutamyl-phosphate reductase
MSETTSIAVIGASGYTGANLLRLLLMHEQAHLTCVTSRQNAGRSVADVFPRYRGIAGSEVLFSMPDIDQIVGSGATVAFLALPHGVASEFAVPLIDRGLKVIDLSADFRIADPVVYEEFYDAPHPAPELLKTAVYGMPELHGDAIRSATLVASPGCYPTSIILPLVPMVREKLIDPRSIGVFSMSGVSGAGKKESIPLLFAECNESVRAYSVPRHRHLSEIEQELSLASGSKVTITFTPHLMPVTAGICTTTYAQIADGIDPESIGKALEVAYGASRFVRLLGQDCCPDTKHVVGTNFIDIGWSMDARTGRVILMSAEDNLGKGAASQAIQSFNLMQGYAEDAGLVLI